MGAFAPALCGQLRKENIMGSTSFTIEISEEAKELINKLVYAVNKLPTKIVLCPSCEELLIETTTMMDNHRHFSCPNKKCIGGGK